MGSFTAPAPMSAAAQTIVTTSVPASNDGTLVADLLTVPAALGNATYHTDLRYIAIAN